MSLYTCFDWSKKLSTFSYVLNLKIDVVPKASRAVVIRWFSLNEAPLGLFKFISDYLPYFEKINVFDNGTRRLGNDVYFQIQYIRKCTQLFRPIKTRIKWHVTLKLIYICMDRSRLFALFWKNKCIFQYHSKKSLN
jgi:hypothetical protein